ncbi:carbon monoxide dehydrogenase [Burkholderia cenocepacia]|nr:carbon monoxide dehydrogenase [Burkholderia cenocepacia]
MSRISINVNGQTVAGAWPDRTHLGDFLRDYRHLTGTHLGCEHGVCGACTVLLDGKPARACITFAAACDGRTVTTVEGYDNDALMSELREAFIRHHALQCGYCTPGMLATARDIVLRFPYASEDLIRHELSGNICRCTGYMGIVRAVRSVIESRAQRAAASDARVSPTSSSDGKACTTWTSFPVDESTLPATLQHSPGASAEGEREADREGWSRVEASFNLPYSPAEVWDFMLRLKEVAACLPGAVLTSEAPERVEGYIAVKFGPMSARFNGTARLEHDAAARKAVLKGAGKDSLSNSRASGNVAYSVVDHEPDGATVLVDLQYSLQGPLAQFSRSGLVRDFVKRMIADFGRNVSRRMDPNLTEAQRQELRPEKSSPFAMFLGVLWERLKGLFVRG